MYFSSGGAVRSKNYSSFLRSRPPFMEGIPPGGPPGGRSRRSTFPVKDDAGYIGYLTDDEDNMVSSGGSGGSGGYLSSTVARRRRELLGSDADVSFSNCMLMMITVCGLLMLFLFAVSPWGVPPPRRL